jgi:uncharacterized OB-fold protein
MSPPRDRPTPEVSVPPPGERATPEATAAPQKPVPVPDERSAPFFEGARQGKLMLLRCPACSTFSSPLPYIGVPLRSRCPNCFSGGLQWAPSNGRATLHSYAIMHQLYDEAFAAELPYNIVVVETEEGVRLTSQVVDCPNEALEIGMPLEVTFERRSDEVALPKFRPRR